MFLPIGCGFPCLLKLPESLKLHGASMARDWHCFSSMMKLNRKRTFQGLYDLTQSSVGRSRAGDIDYVGNSAPYSKSSSSGQPWTCHFNSLLFLLLPITATMMMHSCLTLSCLTSWNRSSSGKQVAGSCMQEHSPALQSCWGSSPRLHPQQEGMWHSCVTTRAHTARFAVPAMVQAERQQAITTFCTLNNLKEVIAIHNLNLMGNSGKGN